MPSPEETGTASEKTIVIGKNRRCINCSKKQEEHKIEGNWLRCPNGEHYAVVSSPFISTIPEILLEKQP